MIKLMLIRISIFLVIIIHLNFQFQPTCAYATAATKNNSPNNAPHDTPLHRVKRISRASSASTAVVADHHQNNEDASNSNYYNHVEDDENDLSKEIRQLVEQNMIQNGKSQNKHRGPPPFVNTLQSSSQEEFIVSDIDIDDPSTVNGNSTNSSAKKLVLISSKTSRNSSYSKRADRKRNESDYLMNDSLFGSTGVRESNLDKTKCLCDTKECISNEMEPAVCFTHGMCYTQYLDSDDGTSSVTKGCISGETPLLCENRRPSSKLLRNKRWPYLVCCKTHLCNVAESGTTMRPTYSPSSALVQSRGAPTTPIFAINETLLQVPVDNDDEDDDVLESNETSEVSGNNSNEQAQVLSNFKIDTNANVTVSAMDDKDNTKNSNQEAVSNLQQITSRALEPNFDNEHPAPSSSNENQTETRFISPIASGFLIGGAIVIVVVSSVGFYILKREQQSLREAYYQKAAADADIEQQHKIRIDNCDNDDDNECNDIGPELQLASLKASRSVTNRNPVKASIVPARSNSTPSTTSSNPLLSNHSKNLGKDVNTKNNASYHHQDSALQGLDSNELDSHFIPAKATLSASFLSVQQPHSSHHHHHQRPKSPRNVGPSSSSRNCQNNNSSSSRGTTTHSKTTTIV